MSTHAAQIPDFDELLGGMVAALKPHQRPVLIAMLERVAAGRYRQWAADPDYSKHRDTLLACGERELQIAERMMAEGLELRAFDPVIPAEGRTGARSAEHEWDVPPEIGLCASVEEAANDVIHGRLEQLGGDGGVIVLSADGEIAMVFNTAGMFRGFRHSNGASAVAIYGN